MCFGRYQQTLAILLAGVLFSGRLIAGPASNNLARALYTEGDWQHARTEALRQAATQADDFVFAQALASLAALRLQAQDATARQALEVWLTDHAHHTQYAWVAEEYTHIDKPPRQPDQTGITALLARIVVGFYQRHIGPAIGQRCAMYPSCSHYSLEACRRYGLAGIPMTADRLVRESHHIRHRIRPIQRGGIEHYADPVTDHSYWFRRYQP